MKKTKLLIVGDSFDKNIFTAQILLGEKYEVTEYNVNHIFFGDKDYDLILFNLNSNILLKDFLSLANPSGIIPMIFLISENTKNYKINKTRNIESYGYILEKANFNLFDISIQNAIKKHSEKINSRALLTKQNEIISIYELLLQISTLYLGKSSAEDELKINKSLELMGKFVKADRSYIFSYDWKNYTTSNTYEWCNDSISPEIENLQNIPCDLIPDWINTHKSGKKLIIENVQTLKNGDELKKILDPQGIKSLITVPIIENGNCKGFVGFDYVNNYCNVTQKEYEILKMYSKILNSLDTRKNYEKELIKLNQKLELKVRQKTKEIIEKEKSHTIVLKQHISDLEEILFNLSHKLRHPIVKILAISQLFEVENHSFDELYEYIGYIKQSSQLLDDYTRDLTHLTHEIKNRRTY
jgi:hypothetical protein